MASSSIRDGGSLFHFSSNILGEGSRHRPWHCQRWVCSEDFDRIGHGGGGGCKGRVKGWPATWVLINALKTKRPPSGLPPPHTKWPALHSPERNPPQPASQLAMRSNRPQSLVKFNWRNFSSVAPRDPIRRILLGCCLCCRLLLLWALAIVLGSGSLKLWSYGAAEPSAQGCLFWKITITRSWPVPTAGDLILRWTFINCIQFIHNTKAWFLHFYNLANNRSASYYCRLLTAMLSRAIEAFWVFRLRHEEGFAELSDWRRQMLKIQRWKYKALRYVFQAIKASRVRV